jgi:DNA-directed RNA polymerase subunit omega
MIDPRIDELLSHTPTDGGPASRYALVVVSAKRARQINNYHHQLGEGMGLEDAPPPLVESRSKNYLTMAMEEIARGKLTFSYGAPQPQ